MDFNSPPIQFAVATSFISLFLGIYLAVGYEKKSNICKNLILKKKYKIELHQHDALFTVEDSRKLRGKIEGAHSKNLFLKNKKNNFFLLSCEEADKIDLKKMSK